MAAAYTAQSILIMLICANICYRYGVSAIWLFGIERGVRQIFMWLGGVTAAGVGALESFGIGGEVAVSALAVVAVALAMAGAALPSVTCRAAGVPTFCPAAPTRRR